ncbi:MAG: hypothetical protein PHD25_12000 [Bacteroidales bacterium]|nr:hypothetical protein [Bacteroidales bacterium]
MKKLNAKQLAWASKETFEAMRKKRLLFFSILMSFCLVIVGTMFLTGAATEDDFFKIGGGTIGLATIMGAVGNIDSVTNEKRVGKQVKARLWIISEDQYDSTQAFPSRSGRERGNIPLKAGEYWHYINSVIDSPEPKFNAEEGEIASLITNELSFIVGGMEDDVLNLLETGIGQGFYVVWEICSTGEKFLGGNGCKPLKLSSFTGGATKDNTSSTITFKNQCGEIWSKYIGNTPTEDPDTVAADATTITMTDNSRYQLTDGTAAAAEITSFTSVTDADIGRVMTILGSGGSHPSTIGTTANDFLVIGGVEWEALANSQISFKVFKDGAASYKFFEIAGTRT